MGCGGRGGLLAGEVGEMSYLDWHVGMKVVCVVGDDMNDFGFRELETRHVYTIRWVGPASHRGQAYVGVRLFETGQRGRGDVPFRANRFRPVQTRKTDISQFQAMLHDQRQKVPA